MQKGFTLIELILYVSLVGLFAALIGSFIPVFISERAKSESLSDVHTQARFVESVITDLVREAESITNPLMGIASSTLQLDVVDVAKDPTVLFVSNGVLYIAEGTSNPVALTDDAVHVDHFEVTNYSNSGTRGIVTIFFRLSKSYADGTLNTSLAYDKEYQFSVTRRDN